MFQDVGTPVESLFTKGTVAEDCEAGFLAEEVGRRSGTGVYLAGVGSLVTKEATAKDCEAGFLGEEVDRRNGTGVYLAGVSQDEGPAVGFLLIVEGFGGYVVREEVDRINVDPP